MPVRIYDISKKLGLENKEVLSKAKELGIAAARVASSSLDKITAEYLEQQLVLAHPNLATAPVAPAPAPVQPVSEPILLVRAPEEKQEPVAEAPVVETATALLEPEEVLPEPSGPVPAPVLPEPVQAEVVEAPPEPVAKAPVLPPPP